MNWIKTDIEIGYRIKCFEIDYKLLKTQFFQKELFDIEVLKDIGEVLRKKGYFPKTSEVVRIGMPSDKMCISFWVQDNSFLPVEMGTALEPEYINLNKK